MSAASNRTDSSEPAADEVIWDASRPTFVQLPDWLLFHPELTDGAARTWLALASYADRQGEAFPGVGTLGKRRKLSRRAIFRHLDELEAAGALRRQARWRDTDGGRTSTLYVLAWAHPLRRDRQTGSPQEAPRAAKTSCPQDGKAPRQPRHNPSSDPGDKNGTGGTPVTKLSPLHDKNDTGPHDKIVTPLTRTKKEISPVVPNGTYPQRDDFPQPRGALPPSDSPPSRSVQGASKTTKLNPRAAGTNPRAVAQRMAHEQAESNRLGAARTYGARMASVEPPPWTPDEFRQLLVEEHPNDAAYVDAAWEGFSGSLAGSVSPPAQTPAGDARAADTVPRALGPEVVSSNPPQSPLRLFPVS